jgi:hypothetical protein
MEHAPLSRIVYPTLPASLTDDDLVRHFTLTAEEAAWACTIARRGPSLVALLTQLKVFQHLGRFLPITALPRAAIVRIGRALSIEVPESFDYDRRTLYRHHRGEDTIRVLKHAKPPRRSHGPGSEAAETGLARGSVTYPIDSRPSG